MRILFLAFIAAAVLQSCSDTGGSDSAKAPFCDTTCNNEPIVFTKDHKLKPTVTLSTQNCTGDTLTWTHDALDAGRQIHLGTMLEALVRINKSAVDCYIKDTSYAWVSFNDCNTGRGYLLQLPFDKKQSVRKMSSAINAFDKKFVVPANLRAYADYSTIYVEDIETGKQERMTFKEEYNINWNDIHSTIDSVNISNKRIFVQLLKNGQPVPLEKEINL